MLDTSALEAFVDPNEAVYASVREVISPHIVDMKIIFATDKAVELFGFSNKSEIVGSYVSMLHNPDDITKTRRWSLLRHKDLEAPQDYHMRIQRNDGSELPVQKHVELISLGGAKISISSQYEVSIQDYQPLEPPPPEIIATNEMRTLWGVANIREAEFIIRTYLSLTRGLIGDSFVPDMDTITHVRQNNQAIQKLDLNSDAEYYLYRCLVCGREWISSVRLKERETVKHPRRCNNDECRSTLWQDPTSAAYARGRKKRSS